MKVENLSYRQLLNGWVMRLANHLVNEEGIERSRAMRIAHMTSWILEDLGKGVVHFTYKKGDGTFREALGTLCKGVCDEYDHSLDEYLANPQKHRQQSRDNSNTEGVYTYWDVIKNGFRTFKAKNLITMQWSANPDEFHNALMSYAGDRTA